VPLETATYTSDLIASNPAASDPLAGADDHIRLLKATIKTTFPNITGAMTATQAQLNALPALLGRLGPPEPLRHVLRQWCRRRLHGRLPEHRRGRHRRPAARQSSLHVPAHCGVNFFKANGGIQATGEIKGPGITPIGGTILWWDDVLPSDGLWVWANGQVITNANVVAPILLARWGSRFGGNGTTSMGLPDMREVVPVGKANMGGAAVRGLGLWAYIGSALTTAVGAVFGEAATRSRRTTKFQGTATRSRSPIPATHIRTSTTGRRCARTARRQRRCRAALVTGNTSTSTTGVSIHAFDGTPNATDPVGGGQVHNNVQPSTVCNYIIRIG
jgi:microcystin-dependent protein